MSYPNSTSSKAKKTDYGMEFPSASNYVSTEPSRTFSSKLSSIEPSGTEHLSPQSAIQDIKQKTAFPPLHELLGTTEGGRREVGYPEADPSMGGMGVAGIWQDIQELVSETNGNAESSRNSRNYRQRRRQEEIQRQSRQEEIERHDSK
jgi:hypothetical protein